MDICQVKNTHLILLQYKLEYLYMKDVNIVIICGGQLNYTITTIESLLLSLSFNEDFHLTLIQNTDDILTKQFLDSVLLQHNKSTIIRNKIPLGVGAAYNQGLDISIKNNYKYTCFCNDDLFFPHNWINSLLSKMESNEKLAIVAPLRPSKKVLLSQEISTIKRLEEIQSYNDWWNEISLFTGMNPIDFDSFVKNITKINMYHDDIEYIDFPDAVSSCICLCRTSVFKKIGYFADTTFPFYGGEDIDISWTVLKMGLLCGIDHTTYIHHFRNKTIKPQKRLDWIAQSNKILYSKWKDDILDHIYSFKDSDRDYIISEILNPNCSSKYWLLSELNKTEDIVRNLL